MNTLSAPGWFNDQVAGLGFTFPSPAFWATVASWGEFVGGICIALGILTRFSALQLAFQFFVISFLWYDNPEPLTGMYFQQTLFWGYVLAVFVGGGRYSLDKLIMSRRNITIPFPGKVALPLILLLACINGSAQKPISQQDFKVLQGKWKGTLTYLDYKSSNLQTIKANTMIELINENSFNQYIYYADEPDMNAKDHYTINSSGTMLNDMKLLDYTIEPDGAVRIVLEYKGTDGNDYKPAIMQSIMLFSATTFTITKMVQFDGGKFFQRHQYSFTR
jgi:uncharacterized membrane protein YphA (DoxX/SURF4 family)